jgi:hypothetical protein
MYRELTSNIFKLSNKSLQESLFMFLVIILIVLPPPPILKILVLSSEILRNIIPYDIVENI